MQNTAKIPTQSIEGTTGYDLSTAEETVTPTKGKSVDKIGLSMAVLDGCYGCKAPRSGLAIQKHIDIRAGVIDKDYRGEVGVVIFNHSEEDPLVKMSGRINRILS